MQGFAVKPLSPSCFARPFPGLAPQFTLSLRLQGFAVKPLSPSSTPVFSSQSSVFRLIPAGELWLASENWQLWTFFYWLAANRDS